jgi:hypothetical protein
MAGEIEQFVERFTEIWADPDPERFPELFHPDAKLLHPGMSLPLPASEIVGYIAGVKAAAPELHLIPKGWAARGELLYIDWTMYSTVAGEPVQWNGADKCIMRGDRATYIEAFFDTHPLWVRVDPSMARETNLEQAAQVAATA